MDEETNYYKSDIFTYIKFMYRYGNIYNRYIPIFVVLSIITDGFSIISAIFSQLIIDNLQLKKNFNDIYKISGIIILSYVLYTLITTLYDFLNSKISSKLDYKLKYDFFKKILYGSYSFNNSHSSSDIYYRMFNDTHIVSNYYIDGIVKIPTYIITFLITTIVMYKWSSVLTIFVFIMCIIQIFFINVFKNPIKKMTEQLRYKEQNLISDINEEFNGIETIKTFGIENKMLIIIKEKIESLILITIRNTFLMSLFSSVIGFVNQFWTIGILLIGASLLYSNYITIGAFMGFYMLSSVVFKPISGISNLIMNYQSVKISFVRFLEYYKNNTLKNNIYNNKFCFKDSLKFENVSFSYFKNNKKVLDNANYEFKPNEIICIVGQSGIGKSTFAKLIIQTLYPDTGDIYLDNIPISHIDIEDYRKNVSFLPQKPMIIEGSLLDNIVLGYCEKYDITEINSIIQDIGIEELINKLPNGINSLIGTHGIKLSDGEIQRIALARILLRSPKIIILDEPTASLDIDTENKIISVIKQLKDKYKCLIIIITHNKNTMSIAHRIINLNDKNIPL